MGEKGAQGKDRIRFVSFDYRIILAAEGHGICSRPAIMAAGADIFRADADTH